MKRYDEIFRLLDTVGNGTGTTEATGNYSVTPQSFKYTAPSGWAEIQRIIVMIQDTGAFDIEEYGNGVALTNGIRVFLRDSEDNVIQEYTSFPIKSNGDWAGHCHDFNHFDFGTGDEVGTIRWTFAKSGQPIIVKLDQGEYFEVLLNDDFSGLNKHRFTIQGHYITRTE